MRGRRVRQTVLITGILASLAGLGGCWTPGGSGISQDAYAYVSTEWTPQTITLVDLRTGQAVWSQEVPVGKKLVMKFVEADSAYGKSPDPQYPDKLRFDIWPADKEWGTPRQVTWVPKAGSRRLDIKLRAVPEAEPPAPEGPPEGTQPGTMPPVMDKK